MSPLENFVQLEQQNIVEFLQSIHKIMINISKVSRGLMTPSSEVLEVYKSLTKREVMNTNLASIIIYASTAQPHPMTL